MVYTGLLNGNVQILPAGRSRSAVILRRLAVVLCVLLITAALVVVRFYVHVTREKDATPLCIQTTTVATQPPSIGDTTVYSNVTLAPCKDTIMHAVCGYMRS